MWIEGVEDVFPLPLLFPLPLPLLSFADFPLPFPLLGRLCPQRHCSDKASTTTTGQDTRDLGGEVHNDEAQNEDLEDGGLLPFYIRIRSLERRLPHLCHAERREQ